MNADAILTASKECLQSRAAERDCDAERSIARCVASFNALTGHRLSERDGWLFMAVLKMARAQNGERVQIDDYIDGAAYIALAGEADDR